MNNNIVTSDEICEISFLKWKHVKKEYESAYRSRTDFSPFLSPQFIQNTKKHKLFFSRSRFKKFIVAKGIFKNGTIYAPILLGDEISIIGDYTSASYTDLIVSQRISNIQVKIFVTKLCELLKKDFVFEKILPFCGAYNLLGLTPKTDCVRIHIEGSFEDYFNSLKKNVRQNYRTAYNRLNRENKDICTHFCFNKKLTKSLKRKFLKLYSDRSKEWDSTNKSIFHTIHRRYFDLMNNCLGKIDNNFYSFITIDNKICGFMMGVLTEDKKICIVPRLAINSQYGVYCPGLLLIVETIKELIKINCKYLDLSRGTEKYKFTVGGEQYSLLAGKVKPMNI